MKKNGESRTWNTLPDLRTPMSENQVYDPNQARLIKYYLQSLARVLLPAEKVAKCARAIRPTKQHVEVVHVPTGNKAYFRNLIICGRVWTCPVCAAKVNEHRRKELAMLIYTAPYRPVLVTYTLSHHKRDPLRKLVTALQESIANLKSGRPYQLIKKKYGIIGSVRGYEVTYGWYGWHPHIHEILMLRQDVTDTEVDQLEKWLSDHWQHALAKHGRMAGDGVGVKITKHEANIAEYIAKYGREPVSQGWTITHEIAKSTQKHAHDDGMTPFDLLMSYGEGNAGDGWRFKQYASVMKNIHPLHWSPGLRKLLGETSAEISDEEIANNDPDEFIVLANLSPDAWRTVLKGDKRATLLNVASTGDKDAVLAWLKNQGLNVLNIASEYERKLDN